MNHHVVVAPRGERRIVALRRRDEVLAILEAALGAAMWGAFVGLLIVGPYLIKGAWQ